jgi:hypothetical protein
MVTKECYNYYMKTIRSKALMDIVNRIFFVKGYDINGHATEKWIVRTEEGEKMKLKVNDTIGEPKSQKLKLKLDDTIEQALEIGALVQHRNHDLGLGLVSQKHPNIRAYKVVWNEHPNLSLFISQNALCLVDNNK